VDAFELGELQLAVDALEFLQAKASGWVVTTGMPSATARATMSVR
jgi:hypothetical protein